MLNQQQCEYNHEETCCAQAAPGKERVKRKGPLDALPDMLEDWAVYDAPDEVRGC